MYNRTRTQDSCFCCGIALVSKISKPQYEIIEDENK